MDPVYLGRDRRAFSDVGILDEDDPLRACLEVEGQFRLQGSPVDVAERRRNSLGLAVLQAGGADSGRLPAGASASAATCLARPANLLAASALNIMVPVPDQQRAGSPRPFSTSVPSGLTGYQTAPARVQETDESDSSFIFSFRPSRSRCELAKSQPLPAEPRSENDLPHSVRITQENRHALRSLSRSTPAMNRLDSHSSFDVPRSQRKFLRRFKDLDAHEKIVKSFSCALVSDILLQGRLYVTNHHFAFYSNLFGHVTRILIPCSLVLAITKEKTARIIPNAVAVLSSEGRHVFGSLLSRDSAYETMVRVWRKRIGQEDPDLSSNGKEECIEDVPGLLSSPIALNDLSDSTATEENDSAIDFPAAPTPTPPPTDKLLPSGNTGSKLESAHRPSAPHNRPPPGRGSLVLSLGSWVVTSLTGGSSRPHRSTLLLLLCNVLLLLIFCSSYASLTRMEELQRRIEAPYQRLEQPSDLEEAEKALQLHLQQLAMVRKSLEALSTLVGSAEGESG